MAKAITCEVILQGASTRVDNSLSLRFCTPELNVPEKVALMELQGQNLKMLLQPMAAEPDSLVDVKTELDTKTPSQRLRGVLFVWFKQLEDAGKADGKPFELFYVETMNRMIEDVKRNLEPET